MKSTKLLVMLVDLILTGIEVLPAARAHMERMRMMLNDMTSANRHPSDAEWQELEDGIAEAMSSLKAKTSEGKASN